MSRALLTVVLHLFGATVAAGAAIVLSLPLVWFGYPWFAHLLQTAGVSWDTRQRIAEYVLRPEVFIIVPTALALVAYLGALGCCTSLLRRARR